MVRPDPTKWGQTLSDLRQLSVDAAHARSRERFQALYIIGSGQQNASQWAAEIGRSVDTVLSWVHRYNAAGPAVVVYRRTGGRAPRVGADDAAHLVSTVEESEPADHGLPGYGWTLKKVRAYIMQHMKVQLSRSALRALLKRLGLSWKKSTKVLKKARAPQRKAYMTRLHELFEQLCRGDIILLYVDEAHFHRDLDLGYTWARRGVRAYRASACAPLRDRINW